MPLRAAFPGEEPALLALVGRDPLYNLFLIANLQGGIGANGTKAWVDEGCGGVLMSRGIYWIVDAGPAPERFDFDGAAAIISSCPREEVRGLSGHPASVDPILARLTAHQATPLEETFAALTGEPSPLPVVGRPRPARPEDLDQAAAIYADADDMSRGREQVQAMLPSLWVLEDGGAITCVGAISARTDRAAMITAVFTPTRHRRRGYAGALVQAMSREIVQSGRTACLFYVNPDAGRIYKRLGYRELGPWRLVRFAH